MENQIELRDTDLKEELNAGLFEDIINYYHSKGIFHYKMRDLEEFTVAIPSDKWLYKLSEEDLKEVLVFFEVTLFDFIRKLDIYFRMLKETLEFDLNSIYTDICSGTENIAEIGDKLVNKLPKNAASAIKAIFRYLVWPFIKDSYFVSRGLLKPYGYPGDYLIVEEMYNGNPKSMGLGYIYDIIFLQTQLCQGLRNRKEHMKHIIANFMINKINKKVSILNVGCGGSRELRELSFKNEGENLSLYLMDFDPRAIKYSTIHLGAKLSRAEIFPLNTDVKDLMGENNKLVISNCDLIYSIGLFDYLPDKILKNLLIKLASLLKEDGVLVYAHKDYTYYNPRIADWFCDWKYYSRNRQDLIELMMSANIDPQKIAFSREKDGYIHFVFVYK